MIKNKIFALSLLACGGCIDGTKQGINLSGEKDYDAQRDRNERQRNLERECESYYSNKVGQVLDAIINFKPDPKYRTKSDDPALNALNACAYRYDNESKNSKK